MTPRFTAQAQGQPLRVIMRWIWRGLAMFLGRKAWERYQRHRSRTR